MSKNIGILCRTKFVLDTKRLKDLYFAFVNSYVNYGNIVWGSTFKTKLKSLNSKIKQASRVIKHEDRYAHAQPLMDSLGILNIYKLNLLKNILFMHDIANKRAPRSLIRKFEPITHNYPTNYARYGYKLPRINTSIKKFSIRYRGPFIWNSDLLKNEIKEIESKTVFKKNLKETLLKEEQVFKYF